MSSSRFLVALVPLVLGACQSPPSALTQAARDSLEVEVRTTMDALTTAMDAHDSDTILAFYEDAEDFVRIGCTDVMHGSRLFKTLMAPHYRATSDVIFEREILTVQILTPTSAVVSLRGGSTVAEDLFWTQVLVKDEGGRWLIAHEHQSWPGCRPPPAPHPTGTMTDPGEGA